MEDLCHMLGINLKIVPPDRYILFDGYGCLVKSDNGKKHILLSNTCPEDLQAFVAAHEIGHALLHDVELVHFGLHKNESRIEEEANNFAIKLLGIKAERIEGYTEEDYSKLLGIPKEAVKYIFE